MQLYAVNFIPLLGSLYMFRVFYTPVIRSNTLCHCIRLWSAKGQPFIPNGPCKAVVTKCWSPQSSV